MENDDFPLKMGKSWEIYGYIIFYKVVPQFISYKLVQISAISLLFMVPITIVNGKFYEFANLK